jgi:hypothetical protein
MWGVRGPVWRLASLVREAIAERREIEGDVPPSSELERLEYMRELLETLKKTVQAQEEEEVK